MPADIAVGCTCGKVTGVLRGVTVENATRLSCMCDDCQLYAHYLGRAGELLDAHGGTDLSYATQSQLCIATGHEQLRAVRLYATGVLRVYAGCCRTPVAHVPSPRMAFVGLPHLFLRCEHGGASRDALLGPLVRRFQGRYGRGELPPGSHLGTPLSPRLRALGRVAWDTARGRHRPSPFHPTASLAPLLEPVVLSDGERAELRARLEHLPSLATLVPQGCS